MLLFLLACSGPPASPAAGPDAATSPAPAGAPTPAPVSVPAPAAEAVPAVAPVPAGPPADGVFNRVAAPNFGKKVSFSGLTVVETFKGEPIGDGATFTLVKVSDTEFTYTDVGITQRLRVLDPDTLEVSATGVQGITSPPEPWKRAR